MAPNQNVQRYRSGNSLRAHLGFYEDLRRASVGLPGLFGRLILSCPICKEPRQVALALTVLLY